MNAADSVRVLHVIPSTAVSTGGPAAALGSFISAGRSSGVSAEVLTTDALGADPPEWATDTRIESPHALRALPMNVAPGLAKFLLLHTRDYDCLHLHGNWQFHSLAAALACRALGRPLVVRPCGGLSAMAWARRGKRLYLRLVERHVFEQASIVHYTTRHEQLESERFIGHLPSRVIPTPVTHLPVDRSAARSALRVRDEALLVLFVGRLDPIKRCDVLVTALSTTPPRSMLALVGPDWGSRRELERLVSTLGLSARVRFVGAQPRSEIARWYAAADIFALASAHENFGLAAAEACAAGLPCVLPSDLPIAQELGDACVGVARTSHDFSNAIGRLADLDARAQVGALAREHALRHWSERAIGIALREMYMSAIGATREVVRREFESRNRSASRAATTEARRSNGHRN